MQGIPSFLSAFSSAVNTIVRAEYECASLHSSTELIALTCIKKSFCIYSASVSVGVTATVVGSGIAVAVCFRVRDGGRGISSVADVNKKRTKLVVPSFTCSLKSKFAVFSISGLAFCRLVAAFESSVVKPGWMCAKAAAN